MMRIILASALLAASTSAIADRYVNGYTRNDGTYVQGHHRSEANNTRLDNYSTRGNSNPYTGQRGYEPPVQAPTYTTPTSPTPNPYNSRPYRYP